MTVMERPYESLRPLLSQFFIESISEKKISHKVLSKEDRVVQALENLVNGQGGIAIHFNHNLVAGITLWDPEYSEKPIFFQQGVEELIREWCGKKEGSLSILLMLQRLAEDPELQILAVWLDVPTSYVFLSFISPKNFQTPIEEIKQEV